MKFFFSSLLVLIVMSASLSAAAQSNSSAAGVASRRVETPQSEESSVNSIAESKRDKTADKLRHDAREYCALGIKYGRAKRFQEAAAAFGHAITIDPGYIDAYYGLGHAYLDLGRWREAAEALEKVVRSDPRNRDALAMLGEAYLNLRSEQAVRNSANTGQPVDEPLALKKTGESKLADEVEARRIANPSSPYRQANAVRSNETRGETFAAETTPLENAVGADLINVYRVGTGDVLDVRLGDASSDKSTLFTVSTEGTIEYPILGRALSVRGRTTDEISLVVQAEMKRLALGENPQVSVSVREYGSHSILVSGLVREPGTKFIRREAIPLYVVLADAQTLPEAGRATILSHKSSVAMNVDLSNSSALNLLVQPGDVVMVQAVPALFFYVGGEVKNPGEKLFHPGLRLTQALLAAGGLTRKANKKVEVAREDSKQTLSVKRYKLKDISKGLIPDPIIESGDRITAER